MLQCESKAKLINRCDPMVVISGDLFSRAGEVSRVSRVEEITCLFVYASSYRRWWAVACTDRLQIGTIVVTALVTPGDTSSPPHPLINDHQLDRNPDNNKKQAFDRSAITVAPSHPRSRQCRPSAARPPLVAPSTPPPPPPLALAAAASAPWRRSTACRPRPSRVRA